MRYLLTSFCVIWLFFSCSSYPKKQQFITTQVAKSHITNSYFSDVSKDYVYKTRISVYDNDFGGLLIIKKVDNKQHRVVFTTEMGNKIFDFSFYTDDFKVNYILDDLNKPLLINILKQDFKVLIKEDISILNAYKTSNTHIYKTTINNKEHYYFVQDAILNKVVRANNGKEKVRFLFSEISDTIAKHIEIKHNNIQLQINLKSIK